MFKYKNNTDRELTVLWKTYKPNEILESDNSLVLLWFEEVKEEVEIKSTKSKKNK